MPAALYRLGCRTDSRFRWKLDASTSTHQTLAPDHLDAGRFLADNVGMAASSRPTDCHAHVFTTDLPMAADARYRPTSDAHLATYLGHLDRHGIGRGVLVQPSFLGTDTSFLLAALRQEPKRLRGVAVVAVSSTEPELQGLRNAGVPGLRFNLVGRALPDFDDPQFRGFLTRIARAGLHLEVHAESDMWSRLLPGLLGAGVPIVIDHFGRPRSSDPAQDPGFGEVLAASREPHVWVKLSAPYRFAAEMRPALSAILDAAGPDRLLWGSDWPWTQHPEITDYGALLDAFRAAVGDEAVAARLLEQNPSRLYWRDSLSAEPGDLHVG